MAKEIVALKKEVASIKQMSGSDLATKEKAMALVAAASKAAEVSSEAKKQDSLIKDNFKRMCAEKDSTKPITLYNFEIGKKLALYFVGGGATIDEAKVHQMICDYYHEDIDAKRGEAYKLWKSITRPVEVPRVLDEKKLEDALKNNEIVQDAVKQATTEMPAQPRVRCVNVTKDETTQHEKNNLEDGCKVGA